MAYLKTFRSQFYVILTFVLGISMMTSCTSKNEMITQVDVPELLDRGDRIQLGKEWDFIQNFYAKQITALRKDPNDIDAKLNLAELFIKEARVTGEHGHYYPAALKVTEEVIKSDTKDANEAFKALTLKAGVQLSLHEFASALETAQSAIVLNPNNAQIHGVLVDCFVELGMYKEAIAAADKMISIKPDIRSYSRVSYLREIHGDDDGAIEAMTLAVKAGYPGYEETAWGMQTIGELYMLHGAPEKAEKVFQTILEDRKDYPFAVAALGTIAYENEDLAKAEALTQQAMDIIPEVGFYTQMAQIYKDQGRTEEFDEIMAEVFVMLEDDVIHGHNMNLEYADIYLNLLEDHDKALSYAMLEYDKRPNNIDVNRVLADIYNEQGDITKAHKHISYASTTDSNHPALIELKRVTQFENKLSSI